MGPATAKPALCKHALITQALERDLALGRYSVGATLPSEPELTVLFGVSRHTVRTALRTLQDRGLITPQQGLGSLVRATAAPPRAYQLGCASVEELMQYVAHSRVLRVQRRALEVEGALADWLRCKSGERWWHVTLLRCRRDEDTPHTLADVYVPQAYGQALHDIERSDVPIFRRIEERFGESITAIRQEISAAMPTPDECAALGLVGGEPVLVIVRRYCGRHGQVLETARTVHRGAPFTYAMEVRPTAARPGA